MESLKKESLQRVGENILEVTAYGDAAGLPVETWSSHRIRRSFGYIDCLESTSFNPIFYDETGVGVWSDDTQLTRAVAKALVLSDGFDIHTQAETLVHEYEKTKRVEFNGQIIARGWGKGTSRSAERLLKGVSPRRSGEEGASGNGVLIKLAPLVFWQAAKQYTDEQRHEEYDTLTVMTHYSPIALWATRLHGDVLHALITQPTLDFEDKKELAATIRSLARYHEHKLGIGSEGSQLLRYLTDSYYSMNADTILRHTDGKGFYAPQTLAMSYGVLLQRLTTFTEAVYASVNLGGDTDSTSSIVANILNFYKKGDIILPDDADQLDQRDQLTAVSEQLTRVALRGVHNE